MSWFSKKVDESLDEGISVSKTWKGDHVTRAARAVARFFGRGTLFICSNCNGEWNVYGKIIKTIIGYTKKGKPPDSFNSLIMCPYCDRDNVRPKGKA